MSSNLKDLYPFRAVSPNKTTPAISAYRAGNALIALVDKGGNPDEMWIESLVNGQFVRNEKATEQFRTSVSKEGRKPRAKKQTEKTAEKTITLEKSLRNLANTIKVALLRPEMDEQAINALLESINEARALVGNAHQAMLDKKAESEAADEAETNEQPVEAAAKK